MYKTIYAVFSYKDFATKDESKNVLLVTTDFDKAKKIFESEYKKSYKPSPILRGRSNIIRYYYIDEMCELISFEEVGWIDDEGTHYYVDCFGNPIVLTK